MIRAIVGGMILPGIILLFIHATMAAADPTPLNLFWTVFDLIVDIVLIRGYIKMGEK